MTYEYWSQQRREGEINVFVGPKGEWAAHLAAGEAVQFYAGGYVGLKEWCANEFPQADIWYTERNGDGIGMLVPHGTDPLRLPTVALDYMAFEWIDPDKDFGTGVFPRKKT